MMGSKTILKFLLVFIIAYTVMVVPQTRISRLYSLFLCTTGNRVFRDFEKNRTINLSLPENRENAAVILNIKFFFGPDVRPHTINYNIATNVIGFLALAFLLALVAATPLGWKRKTISLVISFLLMTVVAFIKIRIIILCCLQLSSGTGLTPDESARASLMFWYDYFVTPVSLGFTLAVIIWLAICSGKKEWRQFLFQPRR